MLSRERLERSRIFDVAPEPLEVEPRIARDALDDCGIVEVQAIALPRVEERQVKGVETALPPRGFGDLEGEPASDGLRRGSVPHRPAVILGVHLREREVTPAVV